MTDSSEQDQKPKVLSLSGRGKLELKKSAEASSVRQSFSHGRSKTVAVEVVKRKRALEKGAAPGIADGGAAARRAAEGVDTQGAARALRNIGTSARELTAEEREVRNRALRSAILEEERRVLEPAFEHEGGGYDELDETADAAPHKPEPNRVLDADALRQNEIEELRRIQGVEREAAEAAASRRAEEEARRKGADSDRNSVAARAVDAAAAKAAALAGRTGLPALAPSLDDEDDRGRRGGAGKSGAAKVAPAPKRGGNERRRTGKLTVTQVLNSDGSEKVRSMAAVRRARERERNRMGGQQEEQKIARDVVIPETITVQELANRMAERAVDVIKALMRMGTMATITQSIDADTAELIAVEFGHRARRVAESDVELGMRGEVDPPEKLRPRPPVVTIMGHVDHGKTSLLDALRATDVAGREAGGITQHIGAYQVRLANGERITFIDTPGHAAFTEMRARGANVTDVVVLVVAADDGIMPQTIEAIGHAKAAGVPIIVAINKIDLPSANPDRVRQELLQHELVTEDMGGDVLNVEVSAKGRINLDKLEEAILLQAEVLELRANPDRSAEGVVVEAKMERGRGSVATVLVQHGTLRVGDIFVAGGEWGRVRALLNDRGASVQEATPGMPVEVLGLSATPLAGDDFIVVDREDRAREITEFRQRTKRNVASAANKRGTLEQMFDDIRAGTAKELGVIIRGDVQGSVEAISGALEKLVGDNTEVKVRVLQSGAGAITESDVTLANASKAMIIGFNVRANPQAREMAKRDGIDIQYYSVIYNVIDDVRAALTRMLVPTMRENFLGNAQIREVFNITKVGKVAGCMVTEGTIKRGAGVRLLRDDVVIHEGNLKTLKRFKDEVKDVREGYECGMAFENYDNIQVGDVIEAFEMVEVARTL